MGTISLMDRPVPAHSLLILVNGSCASWFNVTLSLRGRHYESIGFTSGV